jgi:hypothetical protein
MQHVPRFDKKTRGHRRAYNLSHGGVMCDEEVGS